MLMSLCFSKSGTPFVTPKGHQPAWTKSVEWHSASAFEPSTYQEIIKSSNAVVHTIGTLYEDPAYKKALKDSEPLKALLIGLKSAWYESGNPLEKNGTGTGSYESVNRDSGASTFTQNL